MRHQLLSKLWQEQPLKRTEKPFLYYLLMGICFCTLAATTTALAQEVLTQQGIANEPDKKHRAPTLSTRIVRGTEGVKILADTVMENKEYRQYPVRVQFYINRGLFASQYRSNTLPGPLGVDIGPDVASIPFNYTVIAELLTPFGRSYTSIIEGAVFASDLGGSFDCELEVADSDDQSSFYRNESVSLSQLSNESVQLSAIFTNEDSTDDQISVSFTGTREDNAMSATINITGGDRAISELVLQGSSRVDSDGALQEFQLTSSDETVEIICEKSSTL